MTIDIVTIFPEFFAGPFQHGILRRAQQAELLRIAIHDLRQFAEDRHRTVDDRPFGGAEGMVLKPEPIFRAAEHIWEQDRPRGRVIRSLMTHGSPSCSKVRNSLGIRRSTIAM